LSLADKSPVAKLSAIAGTIQYRPEAFDARSVYAFTQDNAPVQIGADNGDVTPFRGCGTVADFVDRDGAVFPAMRTVESTSTKVDLLDDACKTVVSWTIPSTGPGHITCRGVTCVVATIEDKSCAVWRLDPDGTVREIARLDVGLMSRDPTAAISPDGRHVAFLPGISPNYHLVSIDGGAVTTTAMGNTGVVNSLAWDADSRLLLAAQGIEGLPSGIFRVEAHGARTPLWTSRLTMPLHLTPDRAGLRVAVALSEYQQAAYLLDLP
jgi:hypothetical protein